MNPSVASYNCPVDAEGLWISALIQMSQRISQKKNSMILSINSQGISGEVLAEIQTKCSQNQAEGQTKFIRSLMEDDKL